MNKIIKKYFKLIMIAGILLIMCDLISALPPYILKQVIDIDFSRKDITYTITYFISIYILIHLARVVFKYIRDILINITICKILKDIRKMLFDKILSFKMSTFNKYNSSELYTRLTSDVDSLFDLFFGLLYDVLSNILYIVFMIIMMFMANINLAIIGTITVILICFIVYKFTKVLGRLDNKLLKKRDKEHKEFSESF